MSVDTSALAGILPGETGAEALELAIPQSPGTVRISAGSIIELLTVVRRRNGRDGIKAAEDLIEALQLTIEPVSVDHVGGAQEGYDRFGRGTGVGKFGLNFGDCFAYALARTLDAPLLFRGDDVSRIDIRPVMVP